MLLSESYLLPIPVVLVYVNKHNKECKQKLQNLPKLLVQRRCRAVTVADYPVEPAHGFTNVDALLLTCR